MLGKVPMLSRLGCFILPWTLGGRGVGRSSVPNPSRPFSILRRWAVRATSAANSDRVVPPSPL